MIRDGEPDVPEAARISAEQVVGAISQVWLEPNLGMAGQPRRYSQFTELTYLHGLIPLNTFITYAAIITVTGQVIFVINLFWSMFKGPKASDNPWEATTLEWTTATPPPHDNFGGVTPVVHHGPYEYGVPGSAKDFVMQTDPATVSTH